MFTKTQRLILIILGLPTIVVLCILCIGGYTILGRARGQPSRPRSVSTPRPTKTRAPVLEHDEVDARLMCREFVEERLKAPSTAKFDRRSETAMHHGGGRYAVTGTVDAQNAFGATIRSRYGCELHYSRGKWYLDDIWIE